MYKFFIQQVVAPNSSPVPQKKIRIQQPPSILRHPNTSQPQSSVTARVNVAPQVHSQQQPKPKRSVPNRERNQENSLCNVS